MEQITTVGIDLAKNVFSRTAWMALAERCCAVRCGATDCSMR